MAKTLLPKPLVDLTGFLHWNVQHVKSWRLTSGHSRRSRRSRCKSCNLPCFLFFLPPRFKILPTVRFRPKVAFAWIAARFTLASSRPGTAGQPCSGASLPQQADRSDQSSPAFSRERCSRWRLSTANRLSSGRKKKKVKLRWRQETTTLWKLSEDAEEEVTGGCKQ